MSLYSSDWPCFIVQHYAAIYDQILYKKVKELNQEQTSLSCQEQHTLSHDLKLVAVYHIKILSLVPQVILIVCIFQKNTIIQLLLWNNWRLIQIG